MTQRMLHLGWLPLLLLASPVLAQQRHPSFTNHVLDPQSLCVWVADKGYETEPTHDSILYLYETEIYDAARVVKSDTEDQINAKVRKLLNAQMPRLLCSQSNFVPNNGNVLKLAVSRQSDSFIDSALRKWKLELNQVDAADGRTVLDHIATKRDAYSPSQGAYRIFQRYYERFRAAGAKTRAELEASGAVPSAAVELGRILAELAGKAQAGDFGSAMRLAFAYDSGKLYNQKIAPDPAAAQKWLKRGADIALAGNDPKKFVEVGGAYAGRSPAVAAQWFERAALRDEPTGQFELGRAYVEGKGVPKNLETALFWMTKANGRDFGGSSLLWGGSINGWLGRREAQIAWYRTAWQQGLRVFAVPGYAAPPVSMSDPRGPLHHWFDDNKVKICGQTIWNNTSCP